MLPPDKKQFGRYDFVLKLDLTWLLPASQLLCVSALKSKWREQRLLPLLFLRNACISHSHQASLDLKRETFNVLLFYATAMVKQFLISSFLV